MIELERNFTSLNSNNVSLNRCWCSLLTSCDLDSTSSQNDVVLNHILQHFWSCLLLYQSHGLGDSSEAVNPSVNNNTECPTTSSMSSVENIELQAITEHSGWVCKRVRDTFKDGPQTCKIQLSKTNNKCIEVQRQYVMDLIKRLGEDKLVQPGKFLFIPSTEIVQFFVYLHTAVENIVKVGLSDKDILKHCLQVLSESSELRELWCKVLCGDEDEIFMAARVLILQRIVSMFVKSKQQIIREQLQLKAQKQGSSFRQSLIKTKSAKKVKKQPTEKEVENYKCLEVFRQNSEDSICVAMFLTEVFANPAEAPNILNNLQGREISRILKSLGLPSFSGKSKKRQIDVLLKHNADGKDWIISFPDKLKEDHT